MGWWDVLLIATGLKEAPAARPPRSQVDATGWGGVFLDTGEDPVLCVFPIANSALHTPVVPELCSLVLVFDSGFGSLPSTSWLSRFSDRVVAASELRAEQLGALALEPIEGGLDARFTARPGRVRVGLDQDLGALPMDTRVVVGTLNGPDGKALTHALMDVGLKQALLVEDGRGLAPADARVLSHLGCETLVLGGQPMGDAELEQLCIALLLQARDAQLVELVTVSKRPVSRFQLAVLRSVTGELDEAEELFELAASGMPEAWCSLASLRLGRGRIEAAREAADRGLELLPDDPIARRVRDLVDEAPPAEQVVQRFTAHAERGVHEAARCADAGEVEEAERRLRRCHELDPRHTGAYAEHAALLGRLGREAEAEALLRRGLELAVEAELLRFNLGNVLLRLQRYEEALDQYDQALAVLPEWQQVRFNRCAALTGLGRRAEALEQVVRLRAAGFDPGLLGQLESSLR